MTKSSICLLYKKQILPFGFAQQCMWYINPHGFQYYVRTDSPKSKQLLPLAVALQQCSCTDLGWTLVSGDKVTSMYTLPPPSPATTAYSHISIHQTGTVQTATFVVNEPGNMAFGDLLSADPVCITHGLLPGFKPEVVVLSAFSCPENTRWWNNVVLMLGQRRRRWANIKTALFHRLVFAGCLVKSSTVYCRAKPKGSICLLFKLAFAAF